MAGCLTAAEACEQWEPIVEQWETDLEAERAASLARTSLLPVDSPNRIEDSRRLIVPTFAPARANSVR